MTEEIKKEIEAKNLIREWTWMKSNRSNLWHVETADTREIVVSTTRGYLAQYIANAPTTIESQAKEIESKKEVIVNMSHDWQKQLTAKDKEIDELRETLKAEITTSAGFASITNALLAEISQLKEALKLCKPLVVFSMQNPGTTNVESFENRHRMLLNSIDNLLNDKK